MSHDSVKCSEECGSAAFWLASAGAPCGLLDIYYHHGEIHRMDGPAIVTTDVSVWYFAGHLLVGPATMQAIRDISPLVPPLSVTHVLSAAQTIAELQQAERDSVLGMLEKGMPLDWVLEAVEHRASLAKD